MGYHSLRIGGATALSNAVGSIDIGKRFGRWKASAFQGYLWEGDEHAKGVSKSMASHGGKLWAEQRLGAKAAAEHYGDVKPPGAASPTTPAASSKSPITNIPKRKGTWGGVESLPLHP